MRFDLVDLRLFVHVAETANITHAAARSHLALASASERIRRMEETAALALLVRGRRGVVLTPAGEALATRARRVLREIEGLKREMAERAGGARGHVRLLANTAAFDEGLPRSLDAFLAENPGIDIDIEEHPSPEIVRLVAEGAADAGIAADSKDFGGLDASFFAIDHLVLVLPRQHALVGRPTVAFSDVLDADFVGSSANQALQQHLAQHAAQAGRQLKVRVRLASFEAICRMVATGIGVAILPETAARRCRRQGISTCRLADPWANRLLHVCVRCDADLSIPARRLVDHLKAHGAGATPRRSDRQHSGTRHPRLRGRAHAAPGDRHGIRDAPPAPR